MTFENEETFNLTNEIFKNFFFIILTKPLAPLMPPCYPLSMEKIIVYTDGGCSGNPGPGGWAYVMLIDGIKKQGSGGDGATTNNRMELTAVIQALTDIGGHPEWKKRPIELHTDSQYVKNGITQWIHNWLKKGWKTAAGKPVKNKELWVALKEKADALNLEWFWVKGHSGVELNEECDSLVQVEMQKILN